MQTNEKLEQKFLCYRERDTTRLFQEQLPCYAGQKSVFLYVERSYVVQHGDNTEKTIKGQTRTLVRYTPSCQSRPRDTC